MALAFLGKQTHDKLLAELLKKQVSLQKRIASVEARKRKDDDRILTRKKILLGAFMLEKTKNNNNEFQKNH